MKEIGSEYWEVSPIGDKENSLFPDHTQWFLSGRIALEAIIKELKHIKTVALPSWCCESIIKPFVDAGIKVNFYSVYKEQKFIQDLRLDCDAILIMDFFGYTGNNPDLSSYNGIIIRDLTHSIFSKPYSDADYYFGSLRKWCGIITGGYAWTKDGHLLGQSNIANEEYVNIRKAAMQNKSEYINGKSDSKDYLQLFAKAEDILENENTGPAIEQDIELAKKIDVDKLKAIRKSNEKKLEESLKDYLIFQNQNESDCPMFVPILVPNGQRDALRKKLIDEGIYCPIHWPISEYHNLSPKENQLYDNSLSLVCDQRYNETDMDRIISVIRDFERTAL